MKAIFTHELKSYFHSMTAYVFAAFLLCFVGLGAMIYNLEAAVSNFEYVLSFGCLVFVVIVPVLTMRVLAEEKRQRTDQLLYSLPVSTTEVILGKYAALIVLYLIPLAVISIYPLIFAQFGEVYLPTSYGSIFNYYSVSLSEYVSSPALGSLIALLVLICAVALIIKVLTGSGSLAYWVGMGLAAALLVVYLVTGESFEGLLPDIMSALSLFERFYVFVNGIFDLKAVVFYLSVIVFFLFLSVQSLEKRRYN